MIFGMPPVSFFIMCILWPAIPIASIVIMLYQRANEKKNATDAE